jgi:hypothetical protein
VDVTEELAAPCTPPELFAWIEDLSHYPHWLNIVPRATVTSVGAELWVVDLRGRLGPLARSKRLHMARVRHEAPHVVRFERRERDGREHSAWVLEANVTEVDEGSLLHVHLHYGGGLWGPVLERLLGDEISQSRERLLACIASGPPQPVRT